MSRTKDVSTAAISRRKITPPQFAQRYGIAPEKVLHWIGTGELQAINVATRPDQRPRYLIDEAAIEEFERARAVVPPAPSPRKPRRRSAAAVREYF